MLAGAQHHDVLKAVANDDESRARLVEELKRRGNAAFKSRSLKEADTLYSKAIEHCPEAHALWSNRSATRAGMGQFAEALADANECKAVKPDWPKAHMRRGQALKGLKRYRDAHAAFERALELEPSNKQVLKELSAVLRLAEDFEAAAVAAPAKKAAARPAKSESKRLRVSQPASSSKPAPGKSKKKGDAADLRGYRVRDDGTVTSYFTTERTEEEKTLIGDIRPKKLSSAAAMAEAKSAENPKAGSVWNKGATFEERDQGDWAKARLVELLKGVRCRCPGEGKGASATTLKVVGVENIDGDATISFIRGSKRFIFDYSFSAKWRSEGDDSEEGVLFYPDFSSNNDDDDEIEAELRWSGGKAISSARQTVLKGHLKLLREKIAERLGDFKDDYRQQ